METNSFFDINRFKYLIIRQFSINYKTMLIAICAIAGFLMFIGTVTMVFGHKSLNEEAVLGMLTPTILLTGMIYTSMIFSELNSSNKGYMFLNLPASAFEKLVTAWLFSSLLYAVLGVILILVINLYFIFIAKVFTSLSVALVNIFSIKVLKTFGNYIVLQSIFLLGAIYFRRVNFLKTILAIFVFMMIIGLYSGLLAKLLLGSFSVDQHQLRNSIEVSVDFENWIEPFFKFLFWFVMAPFFMVVSYFRLKERQV